MKSVSNKVECTYTYSYIRNNVTPVVRAYVSDYCEPRGLGLIKLEIYMGVIDEIRKRSNT